MRIKTDLGGTGYVRDCTWENLVLYGVSQTFVVTMNYSQAASPHTDMFIYNITLRNITGIWLPCQVQLVAQGPALPCGLT